MRTLDEARQHPIYAKYPNLLRAPLAAVLGGEPRVDRVPLTPSEVAAIDRELATDLERLTPSGLRDKYAPSVLAKLERDDPHIMWTPPSDAIALHIATSNPLAKYEQIPALGYNETVPREAYPDGFERPAEVSEGALFLVLVRAPGVDVAPGRYRWGAASVEVLPPETPVKLRGHRNSKTAEIEDHPESIAGLVSGRFKFGVVFDPPKLPRGQATALALAPTGLGRIPIFICRPDGRQERLGAYDSPRVERRALVSGWDVTGAATALVIDHRTVPVMSILSDDVHEVDGPCRLWCIVVPNGDDPALPDLARVLGTIQLEGNPPLAIDGGQVPNLSTARTFVLAVRCTSDELQPRRTMVASGTHEDGRPWERFAHVVARVVPVVRRSPRAWLMNTATNFEVKGLVGGDLRVVDRRQLRVIEAGMFGDVANPTERESALYVDWPALVAETFGPSWQTPTEA